MKKILIFLLLICSLLIGGCEDSDSIFNSPATVDGLSLLGLSNGRTLVYIQTDTTIIRDTTVTPNAYTVSITDTTLSILITGTGNDWIIHNGLDKLINLKIASSSVIQNGYWKKINGLDSLIYFASPPLLIERALNSTMVWDYYTPFYEPNTTSVYLPFYYANFGFHVTKEFVGIETIITPAGEFDAYRYDLQLFTTPFENEPAAFVTEYFVPNVGLVKQKTNIGAYRRSLILVNYID